MCADAVKRTQKAHKENEEGIGWTRRALIKAADISNSTETAIGEQECIAAGYRADIIVEQSTILEIKSVDRILPVHEAQTLTYMRLSGCKYALLLNCNSVLLKDGLHRFIR